jgi:hypothetical protein
VSGDYIPSAALLQYTLTTDFGSSIWDMAYPNLKNYQAIENVLTPVIITGPLQNDEGLTVFAFGRYIQ